MFAVKVILQDIKKLETEALIVGFYQDIRPLKGLAGELDWLLCGSLSDLILNNKMNGSLGDVALLTSQGKVPATKIFLIGLGPKEEESLSSLRAAARIAASSAVGAGVTSAAIEYFDPAGTPYDKVIAALGEGLSEGAKGNTLMVSLLAPDTAAYEKMSQLVKT